MRKDWIFRDEQYACGFRVAGVLVQDGQVLVQVDPRTGEYALPGGHVEIGETSSSTLIREFLEETGAQIHIGRLLWVEECFWEWAGTQAHSIVFYYLISLSDRTAIPREQFVSQKDNCDILLGWVSLDQVANLPIYPRFLRDKIYCLPHAPEHIISRE